MEKQERKHVFNAGKESYHHMCRFYSGQFYDHSALQPFQYFWRIEPGVLFTLSELMSERGGHGKAKQQSGD